MLEDKTENKRQQRMGQILIRTGFRILIFRLSKTKKLKLKLKMMMKLKLKKIKQKMKLKIMFLQKKIIK